MMSGVVQRLVLPVWAVTAVAARHVGSGAGIAVMM